MLSFKFLLHIGLHTDSHIPAYTRLVHIYTTHEGYPKVYIYTKLGSHSVKSHLSGQKYTMIVVTRTSTVAISYLALAWILMSWYEGTQK